MIRRWWEWLHWDRRHHHTYGPWSFGSWAPNWPPGTTGPGIMRRRCVCGDEQVQDVMIGV